NGGVEVLIGSLNGYRGAQILGGNLQTLGAALDGEGNIERINFGEVTADFRELAFYCFSDAIGNGDMVTGKVNVHRLASFYRWKIDWGNPTVSTGHLYN